MTVVLPDETRYISFRGTDDNLVAWKGGLQHGQPRRGPRSDGRGELPHARRLALRGQDARRRAFQGRQPRRLRAAMHNPEELQERIIEIYNNDGPGFRESVRGLPEYQRIAPKICTLVPQYSLVGVLLSHDADFEIVKSTETGISAHNGYTWEVLGTSCPLRGLRLPAAGVSTTPSTAGRTAGPAAAPGADGRRFDALAATGAKTPHGHRAEGPQGAHRRAGPLRRRGLSASSFVDSMELLFKEYAASAKRPCPWAGCGAERRPPIEARAPPARS